MKLVMLQSEGNMLTKHYRWNQYIVELRNDNKYIDYYRKGFHDKKWVKLSMRAWLDLPTYDTVEL